MTVAATLAARVAYVREILDRLTEPENPFVDRFILVCAIICYIGGFLWNPAAFFGAIGLWILWQQAWTERHKYQSKRRMKAWRAQTAEIERLMHNYASNYAKLPERMRAIYGPCADCEGMGI